MKRNKSLRDLADQYKKKPGKEPDELNDDDQPRIVEEINPPERHAASPAEPIVVKKCKVHRTKIEGLSYRCDKCGSVFCLACIINVLQPERKCMVCDEPVEINDEYRSMIDRATRVVDPDTFTMSGKVTIIAPEIWRRFDELGLDEDVIDEVIDRLKYVPPEDRLKYINAYFNDEHEYEDRL
ncbi:MAG: hypothetical protein Q6373_002255 [Candidatus Sigynarchaeota archaeon]